MNRFFRVTNSVRRCKKLSVPALCQISRRLVYFYSVYRWRQRMHLLLKIVIFSKTNKDTHLKFYPNIVIDECNKWLKFKVDK